MFLIGIMLIMIDEVKFLLHDGRYQATITVFHGRNTSQFIGGRQEIKTKTKPTENNWKKKKVSLASWSSVGSRLPHVSCSTHTHTRMYKYRVSQSVSQHEASVKACTMCLWREEGEETDGASQQARSCFGSWRTAAPSDPLCVTEESKDDPFHLWHHRVLTLFGCPNSVLIRSSGPEPRARPFSAPSFFTSKRSPLMDMGWPSETGFSDGPGSCLGYRCTLGKIWIFICQKVSLGRMRQRSGKNLWQRI